MWSTARQYCDSNLLIGAAVMVELVRPNRALVRYNNFILHKAYFLAHRNTSPLDQYVIHPKAEP